MNTKTEKPTSFDTKTVKPIKKISRTAKLKIPMPPSKNQTLETTLNLRHSWISKPCDNPLQWTTGVSTLEDILSPEIKPSHCQVWRSPAIWRKKIPSSSSMPRTWARNDWNFLTPTCSAISRQVILSNFVLGIFAIVDTPELTTAPNVQFSLEKVDLLVFWGASSVKLSGLTINKPLTIPLTCRNENFPRESWSIFLANNRDDFPNFYGSLKLIKMKVYLASTIQKSSIPQRRCKNTSKYLRSCCSPIG